MTRLGALAALAALMMMEGWGGGNAWASGAPCGPAKEFIRGLKERYDESPNYTGAAMNGAAVTITTSPKGTWTMFLAMPPDQLCSIAAGDHWQAVAPSAEAPKPAPGSLPAAPALLDHGVILIRLNAPAS